MASQLDEYDRVVADALRRSGRIAPIATGLTASIDQLYRMSQERVDALRDACHDGDREAAELARTIVARIRDGRGGEIVRLWAAGSSWIRECLGAPDVEQTGGNAAQVSWSLASLGAPTVLALLDRSPTQLAVLDPAILLADRAGLTPVSSATAAGAPLKQPHVILEFAAGTSLDGLPLPRSTRVMLRFSHEALEADPCFRAHCRSGDVSAVLLSGLATQPSMATDDVRWATELAGELHARGAFVHHELSEFARPTLLREAIGVLPVSSVGMSLSELGSATGNPADPAAAAARLAGTVGAGQVVVHADQWSLIVTTEPSPATRDALVLANALAAARAALGRPSGSPFPPRDAVFTDDLPPSGALGDGWHVVAVPSPYQPRPRATVGLGDTFTAGLLLSQALSQPAIPTRKATL